MDANKTTFANLGDVIIESSFDAIVGQSLENIILGWNPAAEKMYGYTAQEAIGQSIAIITPPTKQNELDEIMQKIKRGEHVQNFETMGLHKNGHLINVSVTISPIKNSQGNIVGTSNIAHDITSCEERFRQIGEAIPDAMIMVNKMGKIVLANAQVEKVFGYTRDEILGHVVEKLMPERYRNKHPTHRDHYFHNPHVRPMSTNLELYGLHKNGREFPAEISLGLLETAEGLLGLAIICDISEKKRNENAIKEKAKKLEYANKELEEFAYVTSHDLKAPLRGIENIVSWIEEDCYDALNEKSKQHFALLKQRMQRMNMLIDGILHYSRVGRKDLAIAKVDTRQLLEDIVRSLAIPEDFHIVIADNMPVFFAAEIPLRQVFSNLISNAIKHHDDAKGTVHITFSTLNDYYQFCVEDDGAGIPKEYQEKIFNIFQTLKTRDDFETAGIGLAIVKKTIDWMGGKVWVESDVGKGSRFYFTWPIQTGTAHDEQ